MLSDLKDMLLFFQFHFLKFIKLLAIGRTRDGVCLITGAVGVM